MRAQCGVYAQEQLISCCLLHVVFGLNVRTHPIGCLRSSADFLATSKRPYVPFHGIRLGLAQKIDSAPDLKLGESIAYAG